MSDDIDFIPLKNLPFSGLTAWQLEEWEEGAPTIPNNVLLGYLNVLEDVTIVGKTVNGPLSFASSLEDRDKIIYRLKNFINLLERQR